MCARPPALSALARYALSAPKSHSRVPCTHRCRRQMASGRRGGAEDPPGRYPSACAAGCRRACVAAAPIVPCDERRIERPGRVGSTAPMARAATELAVRLLQVSAAGRGDLLDGGGNLHGGGRSGRRRHRLVARHSRTDATRARAVQRAELGAWSACPVGAWPLRVRLLFLRSYFFTQDPSGTPPVPAVTTLVTRVGVRSFTIGFSHRMRVCGLRCQNCRGTWP